MKLKYFLFLAILLMQSCKEEKEYSLSSPHKFNGFITSFTTGIISSKDPIEIELQNPVDKWEPNQEIEEKLFSFTPSIKGKTYYLPNNTIRFVPAKRLKQDEKYQAIFHLPKIIENNDKIEDFIFDFKTIPGDFSVEIFDLQSTKDGSGYYINGNLVSSDWMSPSQVDNILKAKVGRDKAKITISRDPKKDYKSFPFVISNIKREDDMRKLVLLWNGKKEDFDKKGEITLIIPPKDYFSTIKAVINPEDNNHSFWINFSDALKKDQNMEGLITVDHEHPLKYSIDGNLVKIFSEIPFVDDKKITIHEGVENIFGNKTSYSTSYDLKFYQQKPELKFITNGTILPSSENLKINFQSINLKAVDVKIYKVFKNNILQFLQENGLEGKKQMERVAKPIAKKTILLDAFGEKRLSGWNSYSIDLAAIIEPDPGAIYHINLSFKKNYSLYNCPDSKVDVENIDVDKINEEEDDEAEGEDHYYYYHWEERENPCHNSYYYRKDISTNVLATDLGIITKMGNDNNYLFAVTNLLTTEPINKATIDIYNFQQQLMTTLHTDKNGLAQKNLDEKAYFAVVKKDKNTTYIKLSDGNSLSVSKFDVDGQTLQKGINGYIYTERGVWRPGDNIYVGFILDNSEKDLPKNHPIKIELKDPYGKLVQQKVVYKNPENHYNFTLNTNSEAPTGKWEAIISVGGVKFHKIIKIETIKPNRLKIKNNIEGEIISYYQNNEIEYQVNWLQGTKAKNLKAEVEARLFPQKTSFKGFEKYSFNNKLNSYFNVNKKVFSGETDEKGSFSFKLKQILNNDRPKSIGMLKLLLTTKIHEKGGDVSTDVSTATYSPYSTYVGIAKPEGNKYGMLETGEKNIFNLLTLKEDGVPYSGDVNIKLYRLDWRWWWNSSDSGISNYSSSEYHSLYNSSKITTNQDGKGAFTINIPDEDWGSYEIVATNTNSGHVSSETFYIDMPYWSAKTKNKLDDEAVNLIIATDKKKYLVDEKAQIAFPSSEGGRALISIENGTSILNSYWVETKKGETIYELPISEAMAPNAYINVMLIQPHATTVNNSPIRLYGIIPLFVENKNSKLEPIIDMPKDLRPEETFDLKISEKYGNSMTYTIAVVEEGLLDITRFATPSPWDHFYVKTALGIKTWDVYKDVIGAYRGTINQVFSVGGDEDLGAAQVKKANRFKPVVIFEGPYILEKGKTAVHQIKLPNYIGSVKTMVVASNSEKRAYGNAEKSTFVKKPLMILGSLPRRIVTGEKVTLPVTVFSMEKQIKDVKISVKIDDKLRLLSPQSQDLIFEQPDEKIAYFDLEVNEKRGVSKIIIEAISGEEKASYEVEIDVMNPNPISFKEQTIVIEPNGKAEATWDNFGIAGSDNAVIEFSTFPGINLNSRLNYLTSYPHGCSEQTTSKAFPQLYLAEITDLTQSQKAKIQKNVTAAIEKLSQNQLSDGGFSYWKDSRYYDDWSTSYIGHFFIEAEKKGYVLPVNSLAKWLKFQQKTARLWKFDKYYGTDLAQAYRLFTLALAGHPDLSSMNRLRETKGISNEAKLRLATAYSLAGQNEIALKLSENTVLDNSYNSYYFGSYLRNLAMALETQVILGNKSKSRDYAMELAKKLSSNDWMSTQTTAFGLIAIAQFMQNNSSTEGISVDYTVNRVKNNIKSNLSFITKDVNPIKTKNKVSFENRNNSTLYAKVAYSGILPVGKEMTINSGLTIESNFKTVEGININPSTLSQGTEFVCHISVTNTTNMLVENVALTQIIPSGWEIVNLHYAVDGLDSNEEDEEDEENEYDDTDRANNKNKVDNTDIRDDRTHFYFSLKGRNTIELEVKLNASYPGHYYLPGIQANAMYNSEYNSRTSGKWIDVLK